jgi:hypothetical protein
MGSALVILNNSGESVSTLFIFFTISLLSKYITSVFSNSPTYKICPINLLIIRLHHPQDGVTNPEYKLLRFIQLTIFYKEKKALAFNQDRCCHLFMVDPLPFLGESYQT